MPRHFAIETAYARNLADPLTFDIDSASFRVDPSLDVGRVAVLFDRFQDGLATLGDETTAMTARVELMARKRVEGVTALTACVVEEQREEAATFSERLSLVEMSNLITWLLSEVSGQATPTQQASSSDGSSPDGSSSTAGALPVASTP